MDIFFEPIKSLDVKMFFSEFFHESAIFFEIISDDVPIGFYGIKYLTEKICESSIYLNKEGRSKLTKKLVLKFFKFPFSIGFNKILISTEIEKLKRVYCKLNKYGVNYLFKHKNIYLFEVLPNGNV